MDTEEIRLSGDKLKALEGAIPFHRAPSEQPGKPAIDPQIATSADTAAPTEPGLNDPIDLEPYRKKFRKKFGGDVVQGSAYGYDTDILLNPSDDYRKPIDGDVSPL